VIAGLALGVVVVEAAEKSGALITARLAGELGREVMAVPGRVTSPVSRGPHALIRDGAALVESWQDVIAELPARWRRCVSADPRAPAARGEEPTVRGEEPSARGGEPSARGEEKDAATVLGVVGDEPLTMDAVVERSGLPSARAAAVLLELELEGRVRQLEGRRFVQVGRE
jgi:DNA processing protein